MTAKPFRPMGKLFRPLCVTGQSKSRSMRDRLVKIVGKGGPDVCSETGGVI